MKERATTLDEILARKRQSGGEVVNVDGGFHLRRL